MNDGDGREQSSLEAAALRLMRTLATSTLRTVLKLRVALRASCVPPSRYLTPTRFLTQTTPVRTMYDHRQPFTAGKLKVSDIHTLQCVLNTINDRIAFLNFSVQLRDIGQ